MNLIMAGLDHTRADLEVRERFALTKERTARALAAIKARGETGGCVIVSTCNRTELYASVPEERKFAPARALCETLGLPFSDYAHYFHEKTDADALEHLCRVASGLDSRIAGDDQIITQAREALEFSRTHGCTDCYIETMFRTAIKAAKTIKTDVVLKTLGIDSVPDETVEKLKTLVPLSGRNAVVIGNGQMGRLVAERLIREGTNVTMTLREYKKGVAVIPRSVATIGYGERYGALAQADVAVSATASPHYTLHYDDMVKLPRCPGIIVDLAVPRDVEPSVGNIPGVTLLTVDDIAGKGRALPPESLGRIEEILRESIAKYERWRAVKAAGQTVPESGVAT